MYLVDDYRPINEMRVINNMNNTGLEYIQITGLFTRYNIKIPFDKEVNIFIGENGLGKTTILNCIYFILEKKFQKLAEMNFEEISIKFKNEEEAHFISIYDVNKYNLKYNMIGLNSRRHYVLDDDYIEHMLNELLTDYSINNKSDITLDEDITLIARKFARMNDIPLQIAKREIMEFITTNKKPIVKRESKGNADKIKKLISSINQNIEQKILYLPTYRRIEDDFSKLNINSEKFSNSELLIRFGMADVQNSIDKILTKIRDVAMDGYNKMSGVLLKQFLDADKDKFSINSSFYNLDNDTVKLVLDRIGNEIEDYYKEKILKLINNGEIYRYEYQYLLNLIEKLISNYELQKKYDDRVKNFANTCNKYLNGKKFLYNQSELSLKIYIMLNNEMTSEIVELTQLSSGEKQIVSLFSKLYLESDKDSIVIIDEPELSLSIKWQSMLLPDIMRSDNCRLLLTVTHSPFIFENEFDYDAKEIRNYIEQTH